MATPREVALRVLAARFGRSGPGPPTPPTGSGLFDFATFQAEALERAQRILETRRGVIVADSTGLGKTYVALGLIDRWLQQGRRVAVATPAVLRREWQPHLARLAQHHGASLLCPRGRAIPREPVGLVALQEAAPETGRPRGGGAAQALVCWLSHTRLSRSGASLEGLGRVDLVVIDEAHALRSPRTRRYQAAAELCRGARVLLLTATPVNNSLADLYWQLRLFSGDSDFRDAGVANLW
ncbi:MAG: hypothetical protein HY703_07330, partial [Gemmatimonadetes bacterium]|nr:hypothetical protein [Gemmatimonadota bacterium]